jgi:uncharacterized protein YndB with AHSA1/START domain
VTDAVVVERTTRLAHPPELLFALVMSPETAPQIDPSVRMWAADRRPIGSGTRFTIRGRLGWVPIKGQSEVVAWDPPTRAEFAAISPRWPLRLTATHHFEPDGAHATSYTWRVIIEPVGVLAAPLAKMTGRLFAGAMARQAAALAAFAPTVGPRLPDL